MPSRILTVTPTLPPQYYLSTLLTSTTNTTRRLIDVVIVIGGGRTTFEELRFADQVGLPWRYFPAQAVDGQFGPVDEWAQQQVRVWSQGLIGSDFYLIDGCVDQGTPGVDYLANLVSFFAGGGWFGDKTGQWCHI